MSLKEKTKKWGCYHCSCCRFYHGFAKGCELPGCAYVLVSVAQQEIDDCRTSWQNLKDTIPKFDHKISFLENQIKSDNELIEISQRARHELERERGLQKQKLQPFYDTLVAMVPKTVKIEEYDKGTKESWIVQTADPSEWSMFIDSLDGWLVKFKEMLK